MRIMLMIIISLLLYSCTSSKFKKAEKYFDYEHNNKIPEKKVEKIYKNICKIKK